MAAHYTGDKPAKAAYNPQLNRKTLLPEAI